MALTQEQLNEIELREASEAGRRAHELAIENRRTRLEAVRLAKETLIENDRNKPVGDRGVTATDVTNFANALIQYVNQ